MVRGENVRKTLRVVVALRGGPGAAEPQVGLCRVGVGDADLFPEAGSRHHLVVPREDLVKALVRCVSVFFWFFFWGFFLVFRGVW